MENRKQKEENEMEIDLVSLFFYLIDKWKLLFLGAVVGVVLAGALVFFQTPMYESSSTLYVLSKTTSITSITDLQVGTELTSDFSVIATSKPVIDGAIKTLKKDNIKLTRKEIKKMLTVANKTDTRMLSITVTSDDAKLSCAVADAITNAAVDQMASITQTDELCLAAVKEDPKVFQLCRKQSDEVVLTAVTRDKRNIKWLSPGTINRIEKIDITFRPEATS